ncbi:DNA cytosine methyltransferase, partial [Brevibacterium ammoniilyticum]|uniref:DNA cytosine methyltransferase n=2 Tax=Brevibacterium ammoniilyticum TaxID=1046555 RepID=UPI003CC7ACF8
MDWRTVEPVDVLCGGFPCQDVSTVGKRAGLAPGTRSGLWSYMAAAIDALQPQLVVIENVRGLLSSPAVRAPLEEDDDAHSNPDHATPGDAALREVEPDPWGLGDLAARPLRAVGAVIRSGWLCLPAWVGEPLGESVADGGS